MYSESLRTFRFAKNALLLDMVGLDHRFRKAQKRPSTLQPRLGPDHHQGHETYRGDQEEEGTCILEEPVRSRSMARGVALSLIG